MVGLAPEQEFHRLDLETMESRPLTSLSSSAKMRTFGVAPDGRTVVFDRLLGNADVYLIEPGPK